MTVYDWILAEKSSRVFYSPRRFGTMRRYLCVKNCCGEVEQNIFTLLVVWHYGRGSVPVTALEDSLSCTIAILRWLVQPSPPLSSSTSPAPLLPGCRLVLLSACSCWVSFCLSLLDLAYGNLTPCETALWVRVKRHVTHHCVQTMHRGYVEGYCKKSWRIGREHSTYCRRNLVCDHPVSQCSIGLRTYCFWHQDDVINQCWTVIVVYGSVPHLILDSTWVWYGLLLELKIPTLVWHWNYLLCLRRWEAHSLQVMRTQLETLGDEFKLAGNIWWREPIMLWTWTLRCIGIVRTTIRFGHLICLRVLWWDVSVLWGQYLYHRHRGLWIMHLILWCAFLSFLRWLWLSIWGRHCFGTTLIYIVDWLLQWSKDFSDTTVFGWPTLTMSNRTFYSTLKLETWDTISMWKTDLKKELCVLTMLCI